MAGFQPAFLREAARLRAPAAGSDLRVNRLVAQRVKRLVQALLKSSDRRFGHFAPGQDGTWRLTRHDQHPAASNANASPNWRSKLGQDRILIERHQQMCDLVERPRFAFALFALFEQLHVINHPRDLVRHRQQNIRVGLLVSMGHITRDG